MSSYKDITKALMQIAQTVRDGRTKRATVDVRYQIQQGELDLDSDDLVEQRVSSGRC